MCIALTRWKHMLKPFSKHPMYQARNHAQNLIRLGKITVTHGCLNPTCSSPGLVTSFSIEALALSTRTSKYFSRCAPGTIRLLKHAETMSADSIMAGFELLSTDRDSIRQLSFARKYYSLLTVVPLHFILFTHHRHTPPPLWPNLWELEKVGSPDRPKVPRSGSIPRISERQSLQWHLGTRFPKDS